MQGQVQGQVYILRYHIWPENMWKIGQSTNVKERLSSYKTANGYLPDIVYVTHYIDNYKFLERYLHSQFIIFNNAREHFIITKEELLNILVKLNMSEFSIINSNSNIRRTINITSKETTVINCNFCNNPFTRHDNLLRHFKNETCISLNRMTQDEIYRIISLNTLNCHFCTSKFTRHDNLLRHYNEYCKALKSMTQIEIYTIYSKNNRTFCNNTINVNIIVNPITKLSVDYIQPEEMKNLIEKFNSERFGTSFNEYLNNILCNPEHPENHSIKYIRKNPPTFQIIIKDINGDVIEVNNNDLKDACKIIIKPIINILKEKLEQYNILYKNEDVFNNIYKALEHENVIKVFKKFLKFELLNNINMKVNLQAN